MIVDMQKLHVVVRREDSDGLLESLHRFGVVHLEPVDAEAAVAEEKIVSAIDRLARVMKTLSHFEAAGATPDISITEAVAEVLDVQRSGGEIDNRLTSLYRQLEQQSIWGDVTLDDFAVLADGGVKPQFYSLPSELVGQVKGDFVTAIGQPKDGKTVVAVIGSADKLEIPEQGEKIPLPETDNPAIRSEAGELDGRRKQIAQRLAQLAQLLPQMREQLVELEEQGQFSIAQRGALSEEHLFGLQGWIPTDKIEELTSDLTASSINVAIKTYKPAEDENPPTLISYPVWTKPIKGLFDILGTVAGYKEFDVGLPFMFALPIFAAMLIGDGGYGAVIMFGLLFTYKKSSVMLGKQFANLLIIIGGVSLLWGFLCGSFFGVVLYDPPIPVNMTDQSRFLLMKISFIMGATHLSMAQLWQALRFFPNIRFLNKVGWAIFIWGMLGVVNMFVLSAELSWQTPWPFLLIVGAVLAILFNSPSKNIVKMIALGLADFPLSMLSAFSDVISYVRLMAVGLASGVLASSFNELAMDSGSWFIAVPTLVFGHGLNMGLALIALFAHGVRLNMLEFSNNLGMQWTGYAYKPFAKQIQEI